MARVIGKPKKAIPTSRTPAQLDTIHRTAVNLNTPTVPTGVRPPTATTTQRTTRPATAIPARTARQLAAALKAKPKITR